MVGEASGASAVNLDLVLVGDKFKQNCKVTSSNIGPILDFLWINATFFFLFSPLLFLVVTLMTDRSRV